MEEYRNQTSDGEEFRRVVDGAHPIRCGDGE